MTTSANIQARLLPLATEAQRIQLAASDEALEYLASQASLNWDEVSEAQKQQLIQTLTSTTEIDSAAQRRTIDAWVHSLVGADASAYAARTADGIREHVGRGESANGVWATSSDLSAAMSGITHRGVISVPGTYVLPPVALSEFAGTVTQITADLEAAGVTPGNATTVLMPVNLGGGHWVTARLSLDGPKLQSAQVSDSMRSTAETVQAGFREACGAAPCTFSASGQQQNSWSCGDFATQVICTEVAPQHPIVSATTPETMRAALVGSLNPTLGTGPVAAASGTTTSAMTGQKQIQEQYDAALARALAKVYQDNPSMADATAFAQAEQTVAAQGTQFKAFQDVAKVSAPQASSRTFSLLTGAEGGKPRMPGAECDVPGIPASRADAPGTEAAA